MFSRKRYNSIIYIFLIFIFIFLTLRRLLDAPFSHRKAGTNNNTSTDSASEPYTSPSHFEISDDNQEVEEQPSPIESSPSSSHFGIPEDHQDLLQQPTIPDTSLPSRLDLPDDYRQQEEQPQLCTQRLDLEYLEELRHSRATYCSELSKSKLTCFHSQTDKSGRTDSFCIAQGSKLNEARTAFQTSCNLVQPWGVETNKSSVPLGSFSKYWYETGPRTIMDRFVNLTVEDLELAPHKEPQNFTVLVKREGAGNPWHSLMEIMSLAMTFDVLQISPDSSKGGSPFITSDDAPNTQVVILDNEVDGPYFDLWRLFSKKPTVRLSDLPAGTDTGNMIIPLPGASNPIWQSDWEPNDCDHSDLLRTFSKRVLKHFNISESRDTSGSEDEKIIVTFINRRGTRKLVGIEKHIAALTSQSPHAEIRLVDLAKMSLIEQIQTVRDSDVLAGVHGAGLTHGMWLKDHSVMVEILPENFQHKGFRNLAGALGHGYFRAHGIRPQLETGIQQQEEQSWQNDDVAIEEDRFLGLMDTAIKSIYNRGSHDFDAY